MHCGKKYYDSSSSNFRDELPKDQCAIKESKSQFLQQENEKDKGKTIESAKKNIIKWAGVHFISLAQKKKPTSMKNLMLLDRDSNTTVFCNSELVDKIWDTKECVTIETNGEGQFESLQRCEMPHLGTHMCNKRSMPNFVGLSDATEN